MKVWREIEYPHGLWGYQEIGEKIIIWHNFFSGENLVIEQWRLRDDHFCAVYRREVRS